jgi:hypothetical protein
MTEAEWRTCEDLRRMLELVRGRADERKLRLLVCAECRHWSIITKGVFQQAVEVAERYADGLATEEERLQAWRATDSRVRRRAHSSLAPYLLAVHAAVEGYEEYAEPNWNALAAFRKYRTDAAQAQLFRDIFGPLPFRPASIEPGWLTSDVVALARSIYDDCAFDRLPILADALQDAGCENADVLDHCRDPQLTHVRGCWVIDLMLGKT